MRELVLVVWSWLWIAGPLVTILLLEIVMLLGITLGRAA